MKELITRITTRLVSAAFLLNLLASLPATAQGPAALPPDKTAKIEAAITALMSSKHIPGLSIAIVTDNQLRWQSGYGIADLENSVPAKAGTVYRIASTAKPLTAVAVMQLVERGKLDLDAPIQKYVPAFPTKPWPITTRQLLGHLSGIRNYKGNEAGSNLFYSSLTEALSIFKDDPLDFEPGTKFSYSVYGYTLLGTVIEGASGMSYIDYMRENVFKPAKMSHTQADSVYDLIPNRARGYHPKVYGKFDGNLRNAAPIDTSYKMPGGGLVSTAEDLANFAVAVLNGVLIKKETFEQMSTPQKTRDGKAITYGLGWYIGGLGDKTWGVGDRKGLVWHGGVQPGVTSVLYILPKERFALAILTNLEGGGYLQLETLLTQITDIVRQ
jgi:CubicO group peptidase (beta-lactamase class C family)